ncbi:MAG: HAMP domain-containing sensor histidine kinase [Xenococcaceae cyanobacterium MO_188.B19]|nr:HAMP domain-containing sensor histidine kinase [Xenococcaceae cyanobacterium MO_188.B19]
MSTIEDLQEELEKTRLAYQMALQMSQFKAAFLAKSSHEIRSPLSSLIGLHQLILSDLCDSPQEQKEFINQAYNSALKLMKLIDQIIAVSKVDCGTNKLNYESLSLAAILEEVYSLIYLQAANRNLKLNIVTPDPDLKVYGDRRCLVQLMVNLIDGGITLMEEGIIKVTTSSIAESQNVRVEIELNCFGEGWQKTPSNNQSVQSNSLEEIAAIAQQIDLSPNMKLLLSQTLLEAMGGNLELLDLSSQDKPLTRIILTCKEAPQ